MKTLRMALPLVILGGWLGAGCDDDRGVVDLGAGGRDVEPGGAGGEAATPGGVGAGGAAAGAGGAGECPADIYAAEGKACSPEGMACGDGGTDPCEFGQSIVCVDGKWQHQEAFPAPCGGAGGEGNGGAAGQAGGGAGGQSAGAGG